MAKTQTLRAEFREQRLKRGWTLEDLATQCVAAGTPVHYTTIWKIERGLQAPRPALRATLAKLLDLEVTDFDKAVANGSP